MATMIRNFSMGGFNIELEVSDDAFQPTLTTKLMAKHLSIKEDSSVLDLGCGVGILGILAALRGATKVVAVDVMAEACGLAKLNALRNRVQDRLRVLCGSLFEPVQAEKFDIILNDVSGVADEVARLSPWYPPSIPTGGVDGADVIVPMLLEAPRHLKPGGVLYFPTGTISNIARTLAAAKEAFGRNVELVDSIDVPFCAEFNQNMEAMNRLKSEGIIDFFSVRSRRFWQLQLYKAWV